MVKRLEKRLAKLAGELPRDPRGEPMTGAAGGLVRRPVGGVRGEARAGRAYVLDAIGFDERMRGARYVVTGEGKIDAQTLTGKLVGEVATRCRQGGVACHVVVGKNDLDAFGARVIDLS